MAEFSALTLAGDGILRVLTSSVRVYSPVLDQTKGPDKQTTDLTGIWDTGATGTMITQRVVTELGIQPVGRTEVHHAQGSDESPVYLVDLQLPMKVVIQGLTVTLGQLPQGVDVLIGMDVIVAGDFSITNVGGQTTMSFRVPSQVKIDYVAESTAIDAANAKAAQGNRAQRRAGQKGNR
jgi:predicted aspartyl protease